MKTIIKLIICLLIFGLLAFVGLVTYLSLTEYKPKAVETIFKQKEVGITPLNANKEFEVLTWNIGYAGLDKTQDFFYDGGKNVRPSSEQVVKNIKGIKDTLKCYIKNSDFVLS